MNTIRTAIRYAPRLVSSSGNTTIVQIIPMPPATLNGKRNPEYTRARRHNAAAKGMCARCACRRREPGLRHCRVCLNNENDRGAKAHAKGLCSRCIKNPAKPGRRYCQACCDREKLRWVYAGPRKNGS